MDAQRKALISVTISETVSSFWDLTIDEVNNILSELTIPPRENLAEARFYLLELLFSSKCKTLSFDPATRKITRNVEDGIPPLPIPGEEVVHVTEGIVKTLIDGPRFAETYYKYDFVDDLFNVLINHEYIDQLIDDSLEKCFHGKAYEMLAFVANEYDLDLSTASFTSSSGASFVLVCGDIAVQYFVTQKSITLNTIEIVSDLYSKLGDRKYFVPMIAIEEPYVVWQKLKVHCGKAPQEFLLDNLHKIIWDIGNALIQMYKIGWMHGDATFDNVGVIGQNFVLFDFNLSKPIPHNERDFMLLARSVEHHTKVKLPVFTCENFESEYVKYVAAAMGMSLEKAAEYLQKLTIKYR